MLTVVIDTNIIINGLLKGSCRPILEALIEKKFCLATSKPLISEILDVCARPKFRNRIDKKDRERLLAIIKEAAKIVKPKIKINDCRDKDDNIILECAIASNAQIIITNDADLLVLNPYRNVSIILPEDFLKRLKKK